MKKQIFAAILVALFALAFNVNAQTTFTFDHSNAKFLNVSMDTNTGVVKITVQPNTMPDTTIKTCKNATIDYLFAMEGKVTTNNGTISHPAVIGMHPNVELLVNVISLNKENELEIELQYPVQYIKGLVESHSIIDDRTESFDLPMLVLN